MNNKAKWAIITLLVLGLLGGALYYLLNKKYYPKVKDVSYLKLELTNDTAFVKAGLQVQNRLPLPITFDSVHYTIQDGNLQLGWGQLTNAQTLPPLGDEVVDMRMLLQFDKYRQHLQEQQSKDSIRLDVKADVFFDLPLISPISITLNRHVTVPVPKAPAMHLQEIVVRNFSVDSGYSFLLRIDATNQDLPDLKIKSFKYNVHLGNSLTLAGQVDTSFFLQKGTKLLEIPVQLSTSEVVAMVSKILSGDDTFNYNAQVEAHIQSSHRLFENFELTVEKQGTISLDKMGSSASFLPSLSKVNRLEVDSKENQTLLQAEVVVQNPAPIPFYIDSASYFIRHKGKVIASGKKDFETILKKSNKTVLDLRLLVDERAYEQFMQNVQGQEKATIDVALNLLYNLPNAEQQSIRIKRQVQVPVQGQASIKVAGLSVKELSPKKGAYLTLKLKVESSNLPNLRIRNLDYTLKLGEDLTLTGQTQEPIKVGSEDAIIEVPIHLSAQDVNQLIHKALKGTINRNYDLQATATILSSNDIIGPTKINFEFKGELDMGGGMGGKHYIPHITRVDTLKVYVHYDTAWVELNIQVKNPLPVAFRVDSLLLTLSHAADTFAITRAGIGKILPANGTQSAWVTIAVNYGTWQNFLDQNKNQDSLRLKETITLVYQVEDLPEQRTTFYNYIRLATPEKPIAALKKIKPTGFSFTRGIKLNALIQAKNLNVDKLVVKNPTYRARVKNLLDVCGIINRTYHVPKGSNIVSLPMHLGIGEVFEALLAKFTGKRKTRKVFLNATATVDTNNPKIQNTFVRLEIWKELFLFKKQPAADQRTQTAENTGK